MWSIVIPSDELGNRSNQSFQKIDVFLVTRTFAEFVFPSFEVIQGSCPRYVIPFLHEVKRQSQRNRGVELPCLAQGKRIVDEIRAIRWTEFRVILHKGFDYRVPHLIRVEYAVKTSLIDVALDVLDVLRHFKRHCTEMWDSHFNFNCDEVK